MTHTVSRNLNSGRIPILIRAGIIACVIGFSFPIYGVPVGFFKLTFWRAGLLVLVPLAILHKLRIKRRGAETLLLLFGILLVIRMVSLGWAEDYRAGLKQIAWFFEGGIFVLCMVAISTSFKTVPNMYIRTVAYIGFISIGIMALQWLMIPFGKLLELPLSTSAYGISQIELQRIWTYPLYGGGRIIGGFWEPNMSGSMCAYYVATFLPFIVFKKTSIGINRWFIISAILVSLIACIGTGSKQSVLSIMLTVSVTLGVYFWRKLSLVKKVFIPALMIVIPLACLLSIYDMSGTMTPFGEVQENVFVRAERSVRHGDFTSGRSTMISRVLGKMDTMAVTIGHGEGSSGGGGHNAYLAVLYEGGVVALCILFVFSFVLVIKPARYIRRNMPEDIFSWAVASVCVALTWILLIFVNWAQLNQSISFQYLAVIFIFLNGVERGFYSKNLFPNRTIHQKKWILRL